MMLLSGACNYPVIPCCALLRVLAYKLLEGESFAAKFALGNRIYCNESSWNHSVHKIYALCQEVFPTEARCLRYRKHLAPVRCAF
jgi:hypothetical protein